METTSDKNKKPKTRQPRGFRLAYALNNRQPVRCTIISDQPLFYMDFESDIEDEIFDDASLSADPVIAEGEIRAKQERQRLEFFADVAFVTEGGCLLGHDTEFESASITKILKASRFGAALLDCMTRHGGRILMNDQIETAFYDRATGCVQINPNLPRPDQILLAARELRRLWQHRAGALADPLNFHPDQAVLINRAQIADAASGMVRVAWELQLAGEKDCWARIEGSQMNDLARAFAREAFIDFRTVGNGTACCAVFEAWFLSDRCSHDDRSLIQAMLADGQNSAFESGISSKTVTSELIAALGSMPFGKNYLAPYINTIVSDALFTEVRDRSNANFLWFIKFERSFRETEQELQNREDLRHDDRRGVSQNKKTRFGDHEKTAEVIVLPRGKTDAPMERCPAAQAGGARILPFRSGLPGMGDR